MEQAQLELLKALCEADGVSGNEAGAAEIARKFLESFSKPECTPLGSLTAEISKGAENAPHLLLTAHIDQIGLIITSLAGEGFLRAAAVGGFDPRILAGQRVTVRGAGGSYPAVVASTPPHLQAGEEKPPKTDELLLDTGFTGQEAEKLFSPGDFVAVNGIFQELHGGRISSPALDDRAGCAAVLLAAEKLAQEPPVCRVSVLLAAQEETHGAGALTAMTALKPDVALAVDVSFAAGCGAPAHRCGELSKGPMIGFAPVLSQSVSRRLSALAKELQLPFQTEVMSGTTGTDADHVASSGRGVVTGLISIPQRYMHTPIEIVDKTDIEAAAALLTAFAKEAHKYAAT